MRCTTILTMALAFGLVGPSWPSEYCAPADLVTGRLLTNARFDEWDGERLRTWIANSEVRKLDEDYQGNPVVEMDPVPGRGGTVYQRFASTNFRAGDVITFSVSALSAEPEALCVFMWIVAEGETRVLDIRSIHPGDGQWHVLEVTGSVPNTPIERVDLLIHITKTAQKTAKVALADAGVAPGQP